MDGSVIVISYNTRDMTLACLRSLAEQTRRFEYEVIVVDNASADGSAEAIRAEFPDARLLALDENIGFARANNLAAHEARGEWLLLLNPDTLVLDGAVDTLMAFARNNPDRGIYGGRTVFADGSLNPGSAWGRPTPWSALCQATGLASVFSGTTLFNPEAMGGWRRDTQRAVDIVSGCFFLIRRRLWEQLGGFEPAFFMYGEDADLCLRAREMGARPLICPEATIVHYGGASERVRADKLVRLFTAKAQLYRRHMRPLSARFSVAMLGLWALVRLVALSALALVRPSKREAAETWRGVWRRRDAWRRPASAPPAEEPALTAGAQS
jgi:GT2 family glycosyltransferase